MDRGVAQLLKNLDGGPKLTKKKSKETEVNFCQKIDVFCQKFFLREE